MKSGIRSIIALALLVTACAGSNTPQNGAEHSAAGPTQHASQPVTLTGATIGRDGFATILNAPPAAFTPAAPDAPPPLTGQQRDAHQEMARAGQFQNQVMDEVSALGEKLRAAEQGNFVDLYYENEGEPRVVFRFLREPAATLAKYTKHPRFVASQARYSREQLRAAMDFMFQTFRDDRVIQSVGIGNKENLAVVDITIPKAEFRALVARKGVRIPEGVKLQFQVTDQMHSLNAPLASAIARLVRIFPRDDRPQGPVHAIESRAKIVLRDGCFRVADRDNALALFPMGAQLFIDSRGYLAFGDAEAPGYARVGETVMLPGSIAEVTAPDLVAPIHKVCGPGKVIRITGMRSAAAEQAQNAVTLNANALRDFRRMYGLSEEGARRALEQCKKNMGFGTCLTSPPPPMMPSQCHVSTKLSGGLCRTPEGYVRPLPKWLQPYEKL